MLHCRGFSKRCPGECVLQLQIKVVQLNIRLCVTFSLDGQCVILCFVILLWSKCVSQKILTRDFKRLQKRQWHTYSYTWQWCVVKLLLCYPENICHLRGCCCMPVTALDLILSKTPAVSLWLAHIQVSSDTHSSLWSNTDHWMGQHTAGERSKTLR